jgi:hypothetical protein
MTGATDSPETAAPLLEVISQTSVIKKKWRRRGRSLSSRRMCSRKKRRMVVRKRGEKKITKICKSSPCVYCSDNHHSLQLTTS